MTLADEVLDKEFRACGYTGAARRYPLSDQAFQWKCRVWNGIPPEKAPRAWRFAPNKYMQEWTETRQAEPMRKPT